MIDCICGGRLIAGFVVGGGPEYYSFSINPAHARERFQEAHDLIIKAWTEPGPFEFIGKHYKLRYVNPWPRPMQQPHPEVWIPGAGSLETIEFVAAQPLRVHGHPLLPHRRVRAAVPTVPRGVRGRGLHADPKQAGWLVPIYVAETDEQARREYEEHCWYFVKRLLPGIDDPPPGYTSLRSLENILKGRGSFAMNLETWDQVVEGQYAIVGSPETVYEQLDRDILAPRHRQPARAVPARHASRRPDPPQPRAVRRARSCPSWRDRVPRGRADHRRGHRRWRDGRPPSCVADARRQGAGAPGRQRARRRLPALGRPARARGCCSSSSWPRASTSWRRCSPASASRRASSRSTTWRTPSSTCSTCSTSSGSTSPAVVGMSLGGWMAAEVATRYPERVSKLVLVNPAGLYIQGAEIKDIFGRTPAEMALDLFADQSPPDGADDARHGRRRAWYEIPFEMIKPFCQDDGGDRRAWVGPVSAQPEAAEAAAPRHRPHAGRARHAGRRSSRAPTPRPTRPRSPAPASSTSPTSPTSSPSRSRPSSPTSSAST